MKTAMVITVSSPEDTPTMDSTHQAMLITFIKTMQDFSTKINLQTSLRLKEWIILTIYQRRCQVAKNSSQ